MDYRVIWSIDLEADSQEAAAREAQRIMQDPEHQATFFDVMEAHSEAIGWLNNVLDEYTTVINLEES